MADCQKPCIIIRIRKGTILGRSHSAHSTPSWPRQVSRLNSVPFYTSNSLNFSILRANKKNVNARNWEIELQMVPVIIIYEATLLFDESIILTILIPFQTLCILRPTSQFSRKFLKFWKKCIIYIILKGPFC